MSISFGTVNKDDTIYKAVVTNKTFFLNYDSIS